MQKESEKPLNHHNLSNGKSVIGGNLMTVETFLLLSVVLLFLFWFSVATHADYSIKSKKKMYMVPISDQ